MFLQHGLVDPASLEDAIGPRTVLISIMHANNEVGTIEPIREISEIARRHGILLHTDCAQSVGKIPVTAVNRFGNGFVYSILLSLPERRLTSLLLTICWTHGLAPDVKGRHMEALMVRLE